MADTTNFGWTKPAPSDTGWATPLNELIDDIDTQLFLTAAAAGTLQANTVATAAIQDSAVTAAKIANRTRTLFVPAVASYNQTDLSSGSRSSISGWYMPDAKTYSVYGGFYCPSDFASTMTIKAVVYSQGTGNAYAAYDAYVGASTEDINTHAYSQAVTAIAVTTIVISEIAEQTLTDVAAGDYVNVSFQRQGAHASDTVSASVFFIGWKVSYTADS